jgi:hypothetical protein
MSKMMDHPALRHALRPGETLLSCRPADPAALAEARRPAALLGLPFLALAAGGIAAAPLAALPWALPLAAIGAVLAASWALAPTQARNTLEAVTTARRLRLDTTPLLGGLHELPDADAHA